MDNIKQKYSGFALPVVLIFLTIMSVYIGLTFRYINNHNRYIQSLENQCQLEYLAKGGLSRALWLLRTGQLNYESIESLEINPDTCEVRIVQDGLFLNIYSTATLHNEQVTYSGIIGYYGYDLFPQALCVNGSVPVFVLAQGTVIDGDFKTSAKDIHYYPKNLEKANIIKGKLLQDKNLEFVSINGQIIDSLMDNFSVEIENADRSIFWSYDEGTYYPWEFSEKYICFEDDAVISSDGYSQTLEGPGTILSTGTLTFRNNVNLQGQWKILSRGDIFLKDSCQMDNVLMYSETGIYFETMPKARGQFFSKKQILVKGNSSLLFPSYLVVPKNDIKVSSEPEIGILDNAIFNGVVIMYDPHNKSNVTGSRTKYGSVNVKTTSGFTGGIYSDGSLEISGSVHGFLSAKTIEQQIDDTHWTNYLQKTSILRDEINPYFPLPCCFDDRHNLQLLSVSKYVE